MSRFRRPLEDIVVNLSISQSDDSERYGFAPLQVNRATLQIAAALCGQGARLIFGHDWRKDGIMEAIYGFARQVQGPTPLSPGGTVARQIPLLENLLPWPQTPYLPERHLEQLSPTLRVERAGLPAELKRFDFDNEASHLDPTQNMYRYIRARGLTFLRHRLNDKSHARVCVGGRHSGYEGRYPGVIEEALFAVRADMPLYLAGFLGGATQQVINAFEGKLMTCTFCQPNAVQALYVSPPIVETDPETKRDRIFDPTAVWNIFAEYGRSGLARCNGLSQEENSELFQTPAAERVIELILVGLSRLPRCKRAI